jgi:hypothetical protein
LPASFDPRPNKRSVGDVENFCLQVWQTNRETATREAGLLPCDHSAELLNAAENVEKRGCMSIDGVGDEERVRRR